MCKEYGYSGRPANTLSCVNSGDSRIITCQAGYYVSGTSWKSSVSLPGSTVFTGCADIDECAAYGYSGKTAHTLSCKNSALNQRTVTCQDSYIVAGSKDQKSIVLTGSAAFPGCVEAKECDLYGASGKPYVKSCVEPAPGKRTVTCLDGYYVTGTKLPSITLVGAAAFPGCTGTFHRQ